MTKGKVSVTIDEAVLAAADADAATNGGGSSPSSAELLEQTIGGFDAAKMLKRRDRGRRVSANPTFV